MAGLVPVSSRLLADGSVTTAMLADGAVTNAKVNTAAAIFPSKVDGSIETYWGFKAATFDRRVLAGVLISVSGRLYGSPVFYEAGQTVNNIYAAVSSGGTLVTMVKLGLFTSTTFAQLAVTADVKASFAAASAVPVQCPVTAPYTILTTGVYYLGFLCVATTTGVSIQRGTGGVSGLGLKAGNTIYGSFDQSGLADMPNPAVPTAVSAIGVWLAAD